MLSVAIDGCLHFWCNDGQHALTKVGLEFIKVESVAEAQPELVIVLHPFEVEGLPVDPYDVGFACRDDKIGPAGGDFHPAGFDARDEHEQFQGKRQFAALKVGLTVFRQCFTCGWVSGTVRWDDRVHERKKVSSVCLPAGLLIE